MDMNGKALVKFVEGLACPDGGVTTPSGSVLVLGSGGGLTSFLLTKTFQQVC